jgi:hypothetical protein
MKASQLSGPDGGAVLIHVNITSGQQAEGAFRGGND